MTGGRAFDIVVLGFRNDVARGRTMDFLHQLTLEEAGLARIDPRSALPQRLFAALDREPAHRLRAQLEALGAQVQLLEAGSPARELPLSFAAARIASSMRIQVTVLLVMLTFVCGLYVWRPVPAPQPERTHPAIAIPPDMAEQTADNGAAAPATRDVSGDQSRQADERGALPGQREERADVLFPQGVALLRQGDYPRAQDTLERALALAPVDPNVLLALAQVYLHLDKRPQALALLQRAKEAGATGANLDTLLAHLSREVDAEWDFVETDSRHFRASFADDGDRSAVRQVLYALEDAYEVVGAKFDYFPEERTTAVLYTQDDFHNITQTPDWAGAAFDGRIKLPVRGLTQNDPALAAIARHEYAHSLVARVAGAQCPVWLNEGLAVWAEEDREGERAEWAEEKIADRELFALDELSNPFVNLPDDRVEVAYAESYLAVRFLIDRYGARKIPGLLRSLNHTHDLVKAFAEMYPGDLAGFQQQLLRQLSG